MAKKNMGRSAQSVRLTMISLSVPRFVVPDMPRQPPPQHPVAAPGSANAAAPRARASNAANTAGIASALRCVSPRLKPSQAEDPIARHLHFVDGRVVGAADSPRLNAFTVERAYMIQRAIAVSLRLMTRQPHHRTATCLAHPAPLHRPSALSQVAAEA